MPFGDQLDQDVRMQRVELGELFGEVVRGDALHGREPHPSGRFAGRGLDGLHHGEAEHLHFFGDREQAMAVLREHEAVGLALEQLDGEILLKLGNAATDRGVVDLEPPRGRHQPTLARELEKEHEVVPVEHRSPLRRFEPIDRRFGMMHERAGAREAGRPRQVAVVFLQPDLRVSALGCGTRLPVA